MSSDTMSDKQRFQALSEFRYHLRSFLRFSEDAARVRGVTALQYQLMLHTQGFEGREWATVTELAERLQSQLHGVVALVSRCEDLQLVRRQPGQADRRTVEVHLTPKGRRTLESLAIQHADQLSDLAEAIRKASLVADK